MLEDLTRYQEAIVLKKLGFNGPCTAYWSCPIYKFSPMTYPAASDNPDCLNSLFPHGAEWGAVWASAPTYGQAFDWLSQAHGLTTADMTLEGLQGLIAILKARVAAAEGR